MLSNNPILSNSHTGRMEIILEAGAEVAVMVIVAITIGIIGNQMVIIFMQDTSATTVTSMTTYQNSALIDSLYNPSHSSHSSMQPQRMYLLLLTLLTNGIVEITNVKPFDEFDSVSSSDKMQFSASDMMPDMMTYIECLVAWVLTVLMVDESDHNS